MSYLPTKYKYPGIGKKQHDVSPADLLVDAVPIVLRMEDLHQKLEDLFLEDVFLDDLIKRNEKFHHRMLLYSYEKEDADKAAFRDTSKKATSKEITSNAPIISQFYRTLHQRR
jgi:hypothetical protein